ncbi:MAG: hypothetical protein AB1568_04625 [Thermodesulfobacteriota bacterium]
MNAASISNSERLQRVAQVLADGREHSTMDIVRGANVCAVNSIVAELRDNGIAVACRRQGGVWLYRLGR